MLTCRSPRGGEIPQAVISVEIAVLVKIPKGGALSKDIGKEGDLYGTYDVNSRLQIGAGFGHLVAGQFLKQASPGGNSSYPYVFMDYHF